MADSLSVVEQADAVVVGARCAGSATAATLAREGRRVIALDSTRFPSDTLSTHLLWPAGVAELSRLGALDAVTELGAPRLTKAFAAGSGYAITGEFPQVNGIDYTLCVRRSGLDHALVRTARAAGADIRVKCRVTALVWDGGRCTGVRYTGSDGRPAEIRAALVIGADGRHSTVAKLAGALNPYESAPSGRDCYFAYWRDASTEWRDTAAQWRVGADLGTAFPCDDGLLLSLVQPPAESDPLRPGDAERRYATALDRLPALRERLRGCEQVGRVRSATDIVSYFRRSSGPGWALPGDAGHFKDPVTAQGIRDALHYGRLLAETVAPVLDDPVRLDRAVAAWERRRVRECREIYHWTNRLARGTDMSPLEVELYRAATGDQDLAAITTGIFSRTRRPAELYTPARMARLTAGALWHHRGNPRPVLADLAHEISTTASEIHTSCTTLRGTPPPVPPSSAGTATA